MLMLTFSFLFLCLSPPSLLDYFLLFLFFFFTGEADEDEMYADDKNGPVFREGYHQTYIVRKPRQGVRTTRRSVFVRCGNWCYDGEVDLGQLSLALSDVPMAIPILQAQQGSLRYVSEFSRLSRSSPYRRPLVHLVRVAGFLEEQVATKAYVFFLILIVFW